jgi:hypothetical protein
MAMTISTVPAVPESEVSVEFLTGMVRRMEVSYFKYGGVVEAYPQKVDALASLQKRLERYAEDGNREWLMDVANFAMIEFMHPRHEQAHFRATDGEESPGRVGVGGRTLGHTANTTGRENVRLGGTNLQTAGGFYKGEGD